MCELADKMTRLGNTGEGREERCGIVVVEHDCVLICLVPLSAVALSVGGLWRGGIVAYE